MSIDKCEANVDGDESISSKSNTNVSTAAPTTAVHENGQTAESLEETIEGELEEVEAEEDVTHSTVGHTIHRNAVDPMHKNLVWTGHLKQTPMILFSANCVYGSRDPTLLCLGHRYHLTFKMMRVECKLIRSIFEGHGFREASSFGNEYNIMWTGSHLKPYLLRGMNQHQRVNHFPRSYELTRKDRLYKNIQRLQHVKGFKHFDFVPHSYVMPHEYQEFCSAFLSDKGPYIVKPIASSRGRGIYLINHPDQVPLEDHIIVSKYVNKPYLIDGFKFDIRLYVSVTSYDPLVIYLYEEGLVRFATVPYQADSKFLDSQCMHLTNYSINKKNEQFVQNDDADVEDFGNKWSLGALLRYLKCEGKDVAALMLRLEDVIIKSIVSVELPISTACKMFQPHRGNCFELYGFDIILDETLRPWLLEVNLSPSLACDSPLDLKVKAHMISHMLNLIGVVCIDPYTQQTPQYVEGSNGEPAAPGGRRGVTKSSNANKRRPRTPRSNQRGYVTPLPPCGTTLSSDDVRMVRRAREEFQRRGGWLRIFPTKSTWDNYASFLQSNNPSNLILHQRLFPGLWSEKEKHRGMPASLASMNGGLKPKIPLHSLSQDAILEDNANLQANGDCANGTVNNCNSSAQPPLPTQLSSASLLPVDVSKRVHLSYACVRTRLTCYERKLDTPCGLRRSRSFPSNRRPKAENLGRTRPGARHEASPNSKTKSCEDVRSGSHGSKPTDDGADVQDKLCAGAPDHSGCSQNGAGDRFDDITSCASDNSSLQAMKVGSAPASEDAVDWEDYSVLIARGGQMTKFQARHTFTAYLSSVQRRLLEESQDGGTLTAEEEAVAAEQMDLVIKFLRRASNHMHQPYKVHVPSRRLPVPQRKRVLSNVLNDFIHVYAKETVTQRPRMRATETNAGVNNRALISFLTNATEKELEQMLAAYTHTNKSAGIFIDAGANDDAAEAPIAADCDLIDSSASDLVRGRRPSSGRASRRVQRSTTPRSSRSRSSSARGANRSRSRGSRSRATSSSRSSQATMAPTAQSKPLSQRSRSAESPRNPRPRSRPRTASVGPSLGGADSRSRLDVHRAASRTPSARTNRPTPVPPQGRQAAGADTARRRSARRGPTTGAEVSRQKSAAAASVAVRRSSGEPLVGNLLPTTPVAIRRSETSLRLVGGIVRARMPPRLPAATCAIYSRPPTAPSPPRLSRIDRREVGSGAATNRRLPPTMALANGDGGDRRLKSGRQRQTALSVENIYDKITYDAATGIARLPRQLPANGKRLHVE